MREINIVSNPNLLIEMFLIQLIFLVKKKEKKISPTIKIQHSDEKKEANLKKKIDVISQIKNIKQEDEEIDKDNQIKLNKLDDLIQLCLKKKEMKIKYELENNVNLVLFSNNRIEIAFNDKLNKNFIKDLSEKLYEWTKNRWIISFSKEKGEMSEKEKKKIIDENKIRELKNSNDYHNLLKAIPDIELIDIKEKSD